MNEYATTREQIEADLGHKLPTESGTFLHQEDGSLLKHEVPIAETFGVAADLETPSRADEVSFPQLEAEVEQHAAEHPDLAGNGTVLPAPDLPGPESRVEDGDDPQTPKPGKSKAKEA